MHETLLHNVMTPLPLEVGKYLVILSKCCAFGLPHRHPLHRATREASIAVKCKTRDQRTLDYLFTYLSRVFAELSLYSDATCITYTLVPSNRIQWIGRCPIDDARTLCPRALVPWKRRFKYSLANVN